MTARRPQWLLEFDPEFPGSAVVARHLPDAIELTPGPPWRERWPEVAPPVVAYGTMPTLRRLLRFAPLASAVFDDYATLRCSSYYRAVYDLLGRAAFIVPFAAVARLDLARHFGNEFFVRPDTNDKRMPAQVIDVRDAGRFVDLYREHARELVVLSEVVDLGSEYRCFSREGRVFCHSSYPDEPYSPAPADVIAFAEAAATRLGEVVASQMLTIDVARDRGGVLRLVEVGGVNSWGIYGGNPLAFIAAMEAEASARYEGLVGIDP